MPYTPAQKADHVQEILNYLYQVALHDSRIPIIVPSRVYTPETALAVRAYQQAYHLPVTGDIDRATWESIVQTYRAFTEQPLPLAIFPPGGFILQVGDSGEFVYLVQVLLNTIAKRFRNLPSVPVSGSYDEPTQQAVSRLQTLSGIPSTGILDQPTWDALATMLNQWRMRI